MYNVITSKVPGKRVEGSGKYHPPVLKGLRCLPTQRKKYGKYVTFTLIGTKFQEKSQNFKCITSLLQKFLVKELREVENTIPQF